ncbi:phage tail protein [Patiriisocius marinus]|uniref:Microcystin dependent MdpB family protein n=1 Tax=Patiriisocius marinus TaxID=1397112 RepID=A0A5J4IZX2_9FLAO|nr:tail fiber protein [Patiriisocius marinus]GER60614.1 microcystin dependent MdpB family protein [Patiriisocius marinus]
MEGYIAQLILFAGNFAPRNWAFCHGQLISISQNQALFSIIGTIYGGDGVSTFALPDLRGRVPLGSGAGQGLSNTITGGRGGLETTTLLPANMPNIPVKVSSGNASQSVASPSVSIATTGVLDGRDFTSSLGFNTLTPDVELNSGTAGGSSTPVNNMQPYLGVNYIICLIGIYPSRS